MDSNNPTNEENKIFIEKFNPERLGFFGLTPYTNVHIGFNVRKKFNNSDDGNITLLGIHISDRIFNEKENTKKSLNVHVTYGKEVEGGGVVIREDPKPNDPVDVFFPDEYYYDISSGEFFKKDKNIIADEILKEVYDEHIKSTKLISGFKYRMKIRFYRKILKSFFEFLSRLLSFLYKLITGKTYKYDLADFFLKKEVDPNKSKEPKLENLPTETVNFLGYVASPHCIFFYSLFHLIIFATLFYFDYKPSILIKIFSNTFLTLVYVMISLISIDKVIPAIILPLIERTAELSIRFSYESIKL